MMISSPEPIRPSSRQGHIIREFLPRKKLLQKGLYSEGRRQNRVFCDGSQRGQAEIPTVARVWGEKLVTLEPHQRLLAEKAVNDILFEASLGTLTRNYVHEFMPRGNFD